MNLLNQIIIANVAAVSLLIRLLYKPSWPTAAALIAALLVYAFEQYQSELTHRETKQTNETQALSAKVDALAKHQETVATQAAETKKQQEEIKKLISSSVLVNSFKPPTRRTQTHVAG